MLAYGDRSSVREACQMSRSTQGSLISQAFAVVHPQTLGRLHSIAELSKHQSGVSGSDITVLYLLHIHSRKRSKQEKETSQQSIARHLQMV